MLPWQQMVPGPQPHHWCWNTTTDAEGESAERSLNDQSFCSGCKKREKPTGVSGIPAGCWWEGAPLRLISRQWFGTEGARVAHRWAHFPSSAHSHAWPLLARESARGEQETGSRFTRIEPISSLLCHYRRVWLKQNNAPSCSAHTHHTWTVTTPLTHTRPPPPALMLPPHTNRMLTVFEGVLMEHRCLLGVDPNTHTRWLSALLPGLII